jgi:hypothetical protein
MWVEGGQCKEWAVKGMLLPWWVGERAGRMGQFNTGMKLEWSDLMSLQATCFHTCLRSQNNNFIMFTL